MAVWNLTMIPVADNSCSVPHCCLSYALLANLADYCGSISFAPSIYQLQHRVKQGPCMVPGSEIETIHTSTN